MDISEFAESYYERGWNLIPLLYGTKQAEARWVQYQKERTTLNDVRGWFSDNKRNIGLVCGQVSAGLTVLVFNVADDLGLFFQGINIVDLAPQLVSIGVARMA
jgi:hypothetical protein